MSQDNQIYIPESFMALFMAPGRYKPTASHAEICTRYELCEDMAHLLTDTAQTLQFSLGVTEQDVLERCLRGLQTEGAVVSLPESVWVVHRLAELINWPALASHEDRIPDADVSTCE
jgi:hypothetical protein